MKTTVEIADALLLRAKREARRAGKPLRALVEEGLRRVLADGGRARSFRLRDRSVGREGGENPLERLSWDSLRDEIYGGR